MGRHHDALVGGWCVPPSLYTAATLDFAWYGYAIYLIALACLNSVVTVFFYLLFEQALRPVVREIAAHLPANYAPRSVMTLGVKALVLIPAINFFSAVVVGLTVKGDLAPALYLGHIVLLALAVSLTLSLVLTLMFRNSVLPDRGSARCHATRGRRRSRHRVARLTGDELDDMGTSFNDMVGGLRDRAALRDHNAQLVIDLQHQAAELQRSRARIVAASDAARRQVERDLHDGAQQGLLLLRLKLEMAALDAGNASSAGAATFDAPRRRAALRGVRRRPWLRAAHPPAEHRSAEHDRPHRGARGQPGGPHRPGQRNHGRRQRPAGRIRPRGPSLSCAGRGYAGGEISRLRILPVGPFGSSSTNQISRGYL